MSGFEVAGLVLGALPLLISALEHYDDALDARKALYKWSDNLSELISNLRYQRMLYEDSLHALLGGLTTATELDEMMEDPRSDLWKSKDMSQKLRTELGDTYTDYTYTIEVIENTMKELSNFLDIDRSSRVDLNGLEAILIAHPPVSLSTNAKRKIELRKRLKFTMRRRELARMLETMQMCNVKLDYYLRRTRKLDQGPATKSRSKSTFSVPLPQLQKYANNLHCALTRVCGCPADTSHCANLLLEHRLVSSKRNTNCNHDATRFSLSCLNSSSPSKWQETEIHMIEDTMPQSRTGSRVGFVVSPPTPPPIAAPDNDFSRLAEITDLCSTLQQAPPAVGCLGFYLTSEGRLQGPFPITKQVSTSECFISLQELITVPPLKNGRPVELSMRDRYMLALTLASSLLQLHGTPWVKPQWTREDVVFPKANSAHGHAVDFKRPFIRQTYSSSKSDSPGITVTSSRDGPRLLKLGIMLLEVFCSQKIEDYKQEVDSTAEPDLSDESYLVILQQWLKAKVNEGNLSLASKDAISHCIWCFAEPCMDLQDSNFQQGIVDRIVVPLLDELQHWPRDD